MRRAALTLLACLSVPAAVALSAGPCAAATNLERLVMPGLLTQAHADLEDDCRNCHEPFSRNTQSALCRKCHHDVDADLVAREGFHGRLPSAGGDAASDALPCQLCHTDHEGRGADIVKLDVDTFAHERTDFPLDGAHVFAACRSCHRDGSKHREAGTGCFDCHRNDDAHNGFFGRTCNECHTVQAWTGAKFDHDTTDFALAGAHTDVTCVKCHPGARYDDTPQTCSGCHAQDDVHSGRNGSDCRRCHKPTEWRETAFKHDRDTDFALLGAHARLACESCHSGDPYRDKLSTRCAGCHAGDDVHQTALGESCDSCHSADGWLLRILFDHELARFPLVGLHAAVACEQCHLSQEFKGTAKDCTACHARDDVHERLLGTDCADCHNPNGWAAWIFDHGTDAGYRLDGAHIGLQCAACHTRGPVRQVAQPSACNDCHARDDAHSGRFGARCDACHSTASFSQAVMR
jgi:hypothetical protein